ncbi:hypothetical protein AOC36_00340 [Erysipelothrix larvae]|uniref:Arsenic metallochaperone ArsD family protein n=1 Tax=Erysipelothrix larvae TaxID=1514105 RepID=A0A0X8GXZ7_9FIRM|nr:arsenic metallochaperone ArsD family protein [Erysipelothrix larvae]AMC92495.1 hypothetical protein AOC36_00340 [Erysipelothrix larvae]
MSKTINVYEKEADLSHIILGVENDPKRAQFNEIVKILQNNGYAVNRFDPVHNKEAMKDHVNLPSIYLHDTLIFQGEYPTCDEVAGVLGLDNALFSGIQRTNLLNEANTTRLGSCCGVGQDVYFDPDEDELWK